MPFSPSDKYESTVNPVAQCLESTRQLIAGLLRDGQIRCNVSESGRLDQKTGLADISIVVAGFDDIANSENVLNQALTIIVKTWTESLPGSPPSRRLEALIPPQCKPAGWSDFESRPTSFSLAIDANVEVTTDLTILPFKLPRPESGYTLVMKGGGIKGLAYVGALEILLEKFQFDHFVGTSAGAISAVLLAADYSPSELVAILKQKNFRDFFDAPWYRVVPNLIFYGGIHHAHTLSNWIDQLLAEKLRSATRVKLSDLPYRATIFASRRNKKALRFDSGSNDAEAAHAVRCSMSIPIVFVPQSDQGFRTYDGGLQNNFPLREILDEDQTLAFVSLFLGPEVYKPTPRKWEPLEWISIWTEGGDADLVRKYRDATVIIDPDPIGTLDFDLTTDEKDFLLWCGRAGALAFLERGSERYKNAVAVRDALRTSVDASCKYRRQRRKFWGLICISVAVGIFTVLFRFLYLFFWK